ncbi:MAG: V-type ATP synthase subunit F [Promethearchaeota archaeon]
MKIIMFGDEESTIMFHLIGIEGIIHEREKDDINFKNRFQEVLNDPEVGIIIITERILINHKDFILPLKMQRRIPTIVEIPSMITELHEDYVHDVVKKYIGIKFTEG